MGIFDKLKPKRKTEEFNELKAQSVLKGAAEIYRQTIEERDKLLAELHRAVEGLGERDKALLQAADDGLIPAPSHFTSRLEILRRIRVQVDRVTAEAGVVVDNKGAALELLRRQSWWPEFIAHVRAEMGIRTANDIGQWTNATKKLAPYIYEAGRMYQTLDDYRKNGPIAQWTWRVDLTAGTVKTIGAHAYDECISRLADKVIGLSFAMWAQRDTMEEVVENVQDRENIDWTMIAFEYMMCFRHLIDRYAFGLYGAQFRAELMDSLYDPLLRKFVETGAVRADRLEEFRSIFIDALNERTAEYANYALNIDAIDHEGAHEVLEGTLLWEFGKRLASIIGGTNPARVTAYVRDMVIAGLLVIAPLKMLEEVKELMDAGNVA